MCVLTNGRNYIGLNSDNSQTTVGCLSRALSFSDKQKAINYKDNLKTTLRKFDWQLVEIGDTSENLSEFEDSNDIEIQEYVETALEKAGFDIVSFFNNAITTITQLKEYAANMNLLEKEYNAKIKDIRHYKRDKRTKLNAIQLQRLEQFEIQIERERYECKSNRIIAEIFLTDLSRMENNSYIEVIKNIKESEYKPEIFTFEFLDEIVGKRTVKKVV